MLFQKFIVAEKDVYQRIDHFLVKQDIGISRTYIQRLIKDGHVTVNNKSVKSKLSAPLE